MTQYQPHLLREEPTTVEEYEFEPIKGYPMLRWRGKRPFTTTQYYPAQQKESHGREIDGWRNKLYWGDNLQVMSHLLKQYRGKVQLVYIDPPFDSKADYKKQIRLRGKRITNDHSSFEEKQYTDIWTNDEYLQFMYERIVLIRELLSTDGSILVHCDYHQSHFLRCMLDEVFGTNNFRNEIIIKRPITKNLQAQFDSIHSLSCGHDNLFLYSKSPSTRYKQAYDKYVPKHPQGYWHRFWSGANRPTMRYELLGVEISDGQWKWSKKRALEAAKNYEAYREQAEKNENLSLVDYWRQTGEKLEFLRKSDKGTIENWFPPKNKKLANTLWLDYQSYENRKNYPTQKHEDLLFTIVERLSEPKDLVFDCFMGSGTTQAVAMKLGRRFIGADINLGAVQISTKRLLGVAQELENQQLNLLDTAKEDQPTTYYTGFEVYNVNNYDIFRNPLEAKNLLIEALEIHPLGVGHLFDGEKDGRMVKIMPVNRIATAADLNELINGFDYKAFQKRFEENSTRPVEKVTLVCMGHDPALKATLLAQVEPYKLDIQIVDILRDKSELQFKREAEAQLSTDNGHLTIQAFYPLNLLKKLSLQKERVGEWRELVESIMVDWNYDGAIFQPALVDIPEKDDLVAGRYSIPADAGTIRVKITDLLSESLELEVSYG